MAGKTSSVSSLPPLSWLDVSFDVSQSLLNIFDVVTDMLVVAQFYQSAESGLHVYAIVGTCILAIAQIALLIFFTMEFSPNLYCLYLPFVQLAPVLKCMGAYYARSATVRILFACLRIDRNYGYSMYDTAARTPQHDDPLVNYIQNKLRAYGGFVIESMFESVPMSILQIVAMVLRPELFATNWLNILSLTLSISSLASKGFIMSFAIDRCTFIFNCICVVADIFGLFATISWLFFSYSNSGSSVTFLSSSVDLQINVWSAIWLYKEAAVCVIAFLCLYAYAWYAFVDFAGTRRGRRTGVFTKLFYIFLGHSAVFLLQLPMWLVLISARVTLVPYCMTATSTNNALVKVKDVYADVRALYAWLRTGVYVCKTKTKKREERKKAAAAAAVNVTRKIDEHAFDKNASQDPVVEKGAVRFHDDEDSVRVVVEDDLEEKKEDMSFAPASASASAPASTSAPVPVVQAIEKKDDDDDDDDDDDEGLIIDSRSYSTLASRLFSTNRFIAYFLFRYYPPTETHPSVRTDVLDVRALAAKQVYGDHAVALRVLCDESMNVSGCRDSITMTQWRKLSGRSIAGMFIKNLNSSNLTHKGDLLVFAALPFVIPSVLYSLVYPLISFCLFIASNSLSSAPLQMTLSLVYLSSLFLLLLLFPAVLRVHYLDLHIVTLSTFLSVISNCTFAHHAGSSMTTTTTTTATTTTLTKTKMKAKTDYYSWLDELVYSHHAVHALARTRRMLTGEQAATDLNHHHHDDADDGLLRRLLPADMMKIVSSYLITADDVDTAWYFFPCEPFSPLSPLPRSESSPSSSLSPSSSSSSSSPSSSSVALPLVLPAVAPPCTPVPGHGKEEKDLH